VILPGVGRLPSHFFRPTKATVQWVLRQPGSTARAGYVFAGGLAKGDARSWASMSA
jgi:hypothetical protein